jgi:hypothetical protein
MPAAVAACLGEQVSSRTWKNTSRRSEVKVLGTMSDARKMAYDVIVSCQARTGRHRSSFPIKELRSRGAPPEDQRA